MHDVSLNELSLVISVITYIHGAYSLADGFKIPKNLVLVI